jgi:hypothetical protein
MYFISDQYNARIGAEQDFEGESTTTDDYQKEVYETAQSVAKVRGYQTIFDFGAGSGFKLIQFFSDRHTVGLDLPPAVKILRQKYPDREWITSGDPLPLSVDLVICSDVIEHVDDPDWLCNFIKSLNPKHVVISTPDRDLICNHHGQPPLGPPRNRTHVREWNFAEFGNYMDSQFAVERLFYSNREQYTMCVVARPK